VEHRFRLRPGQTFALYVALYTFGRFFFELMRSDPATRVFGVRFNALLSAALCIGSGIWFVAASRRKPETAGGDEGHTVGEADLEAPTP
jgi:prolipoprotein diacylglyceryltransferase